MIKLNTKHRKNLHYFLIAAVLLIIFLAYSNLNIVSVNFIKVQSSAVNKFESFDSGHTNNKEQIVVIKKDDIVELLKKHLNSQNEEKTEENVKTGGETPKKNSMKYDFQARYPHFLECYNKELPKWSLATMYSEARQKEYAQPAKESTHSLRITRAILFYFPVEKTSEFVPEFRWVYRSWIEMQKTEPTKWRTDLIVFIHTNVKELNELNCTYENKRKTDQDEPMCTLLPYTAVKNRNLTEIKDPLFKKENIYEAIDVNKNIYEKYEYLLNNVDIFSDDEANLLPFITVLQQNLYNYGYLDSILMAFEGYKYFKEAKYDFLIRSDMDVFLTPLFSKWIPMSCNDFVVGGGGYSDKFNVNRLKRIANDLEFQHAGQWNLGSTWYSTPDQFRLVAYLTLFGMAYIGKEEFSLPEREGKAGTELWPQWHYGVLLLYGQNLGMNHLIGAKQINVPKLFNYIDHPSSNPESVYEVIHIHVYHGPDIFSKFAFKMGKYDNMSVPVKDTHQINNYCLKIALESKRTELADLVKLHKIEISKKN